MRAGFEYFRNFERDAEDFARMGSKRRPNSSRPTSAARLSPAPATGWWRKRPRSWSPPSRTSSP